MKILSDFVRSGACVVVVASLLLMPEAAWAVENPKRMLMIFPAVTVVILVIAILVTRKR